MKPASRLFAFYGSLMQGVTFPRPPDGILEGLHKIGSVELKGSLYVVRGTNPPYPGFAPDVNGLNIKADLCIVSNSKTVELLDKWEAATTGTEPGFSYRRQLMSVYTNGQYYTTWVYAGSHTSSMRDTLSVTDWKEWLKENSPESLTLAKR